MADLTRLRIAVLGAGGIGSTFAFYLARVGGHEVTAIARTGSKRLEQLRRDGGVVNTAGERAPMQVAAVLDEAVEYDLVLVTLLAHQVEAVLPALQRSRARWIQFMFNQFEPERLLNEVGAERSSCGMPFVQASIDPEGRLKASVGAGGQKSRMSEARWVTVFNAAGLPAMLDPRMQLWLRCHVPLCVAFESVSLTAVRKGGGASWAECLVVASGLRESLTMIERLGYELYPTGKQVLKRGPVFVAAGMFWSLSRVQSFRELLATGAAEGRALVDVLLAAGAKVQPGVDLARIEAMRPPG